MKQNNNSVQSSIYDSYIRGRTIEAADYIVSTGATLRKAAEKLGVSKSTIHIDVTERLKFIDKKLWKAVEKVLQKNKEERHIRGGMATKMKSRLKKQ